MRAEPNASAPSLSRGRSPRTSPGSYAVTVGAVVTAAGDCAAWATYDPAQPFWVSDCFNEPHALITRRAEHDMAEAGLWYESRLLGTALYFIRCVLMPRLRSSLAIPRPARCNLDRCTACSSRDFHLVCSTRSRRARSSFTRFFTRRVTRTRFASCCSPKPMHQWPDFAAPLPPAHASPT